MYKRNNAAPNTIAGTISGSSRKDWVSSRVVNRYRTSPYAANVPRITDKTTAPNATTSELLSPLLNSGTWNSAFTYQCRVTPVKGNIPYVEGLTESMITRASGASMYTPTMPRKHQSPTVRASRRSDISSVLRRSRQIVERGGLRPG